MSKYETPVLPGRLDLLTAEDLHAMARDYEQRLRKHFGTDKYEHLEADADAQRLAYLRDKAFYTAKEVLKRFWLGETREGGN